MDIVVGYKGATIYKNRIIYSQTVLAVRRHKYDCFQASFPKDI